MAIWRYSLWDAVMFALNIFHMVATFMRVVYWGIKVIIGLKVLPIFDHAKYASTFIPYGFQDASRRQGSESPGA